MSSKKGDLQRKRPQKHQNRTSFKNDLHDKSDRIKKLNSMNICEVCEHCRGVIEWKIKYKKYKALSQPKTCNKCGNKTVKKAYHQICRDCVQTYRQCAKCLKSESEQVQIIPAEPSPEDQIKLKVEMNHLIKSLSERKRRTFLRYMEKGKKVDKKKKNKSDDDPENEEEPNEIVPHTREELLHKIEKLKLTTEDKNEDDFYAGIDDSDSDLDSECDEKDYDSDDLISD